MGGTRKYKTENHEENLTFWINDYLDERSFCFCLSQNIKAWFGLKYMNMIHVLEKNRQEIN